MRAVPHEQAEEAILAASMYARWTQVRPITGKRPGNLDADISAHCHPHLRKAPEDTRDVPTYHTNRQTPAQANRQLDYAFASGGFHETVTVRALNGVEEWGPSDHCRLLIEVVGT